jgi:hypothetical protein
MAALDAANFFSGFQKMPVSGTGTMRFLEWEWR